MAASVTDRLELAVGGQTTVTLPGLGAAGYRWTGRADDPDLVSLSRDLSDTEVGPPGESRAERFTVTGLAVGATVIHFQLCRPFQPNRPPREVCDISVTVH